MIPGSRAPAWLRRCLYTPRRAVGLTAASLTALILVGQALPAAQHHHSASQTTTSETTTRPTFAAAPTLTPPARSTDSADPAAPPVSRDTPATPVTAAATDTATRFAIAWVDRRTDQATRWRILAPLVTPELAQQLRGTAAAGIPATAVTGPATPLADTSVGVLVEVPTDAGGLLIRVVAAGRLVADARFNNETTDAAGDG